MKIPFYLPVLLFITLCGASCSSSQELDGRKYYAAHSPIQGKMGVQYKRVKSSTPPAADTPTTGVESEPPGLMDRNDKPDEPGAEYWLHGRQSADPILGKMGVRITRQKK